MRKHSALMMELLVGLMIVGAVASFFMPRLSLVMRNESKGSLALQQVFLRDHLFFQGFEELLKRAEDDKGQLIRDLAMGFSKSFDEEEVLYEMDKGPLNKRRYILVTLTALNQPYPVILECEK